MTDKEYNRRIDNEAVFRRYNEAVTEGLDNLVAIAEREGWSNDITTIDDPIYFYCECSREDCRQRVRLIPAEYEAIHNNRKRFTIKCGHETPSVERVVEHGESYYTVEKFDRPDENATQLKHTDLGPTDEL